MAEEDRDRTTIRLPLDVKQALERQAERDVRTLQGQIEFYCREGLRRDGVDLGTGNHKQEG